MANLNIKFNNRQYSIDSSLLADATARLETHLVSMMREPTEPKLGFPITWNSMEVIDNASYPMGEIGVVKVSDYIPSIDEIAKTSFTLTSPDETITYRLGNAYEESGVISVVYKWREGTDVASLNCLYVFIPFDLGDGMVMDVGVYAPNFGAHGGDVDCVIDLVGSDGDVAL